MVRRKNTIHARSNDISEFNTGAEYPIEAVEFEKAIETFIRHCRVRNLSDQSIKYYRETLRELTKTIEVERPMDVEKRDIEDCILANRDKGKKDGAINALLRSWRVFFRFLHEEGYISNNIADQVKLIKSEKRIIEAFTTEQVKALLNVPNRKTFTGYRNYVLMLLLLDTGVRIGEVARIKVTDINWKDRSILIFGKGRKERIVPFQKTLDRHLKEYVKIRGYLDHDYLFINIDNKPMAIRSMQDEIKKIGLEAGVRGVRVSPHTFRHTFAKFYILNGGDVFSLQKLLGHSTLEMCQTYVNLYGTDIAKQHSKYSPLEHL